MMVATVLNWPTAATLEGSLIPSLSLRYERTLQFCDFHPTIVTKKKREVNQRMRFRLPLILCCSDSNTSTIPSTEAMTPMTPSLTTTIAENSPPPIRKRRRRRYRKQYPGEKKGITEEMRFVAMKLRNTTKFGSNPESDNSEGENVDVDDCDESISSGGDGGGGGSTWQPSMEGFLNYLVDSKLVFDTVERIVDESSDVSYAYFRMTGLERSVCLSKDLEWFSQQNVVIPEPSNPGVSYANYLKELAEKSPPLFLCHFYNIYFSHIAGGQVIAKQVSNRLSEGRELEFYSWEGDAAESLRGIREKLNMLGEHWSRDEKNKCLREATKSFRFLGQIVRLIIF